MKKSALLILLVSFFVNKAVANNISISNISVLNNAGNTGKIIEFDLSWENSWRAASTNNYDGAWVFFKFKDLDGRWYPLRFTGSNINMPAGVSYDMGDNGATVGIGMFLYRSNFGTGTFTITDARAGIQSYPGTFDIRGFAIEMVYVPTGSFYAGDGVSNLRYSTGSIGSPFQITGLGNTINMATTGTALNDPQASGYTGNLSGFPAGYSAFWMMKYEVSQGAYRDFLNTLTYPQQAARFVPTIFPHSAVGSNIAYDHAEIRQYIEIATSGNAASSTPAVLGCDGDADNIYNEASDGEWIPVSRLTWPDAAAYLDWAGLRPMSELEFEKACRGPLSSIEDEFAWGSNSIAVHSYTLVNAGMTNEAISNMSSFSGNAVNDSSNISIVRGGIFATASSTRTSSGAGYYGAMELSGNGFEFCVTTANAAGRSYTGKHGDGILASSGNANESYWPGVNGATGTSTSTGTYNGGQGVNSDGGLMNRGGYIYQVQNLKVSYRGTPYTGSAVIVSGFNPVSSIRGVRDAN